MDNMGSTNMNGSTKGPHGDRENGSDPATIPLAIVGMACRFAGGVSSPEKLWDFVSNARSAWSLIPQTRFNMPAFYDRQPDKVGSTHIRGGYFLDEDVALFDTSFFNLSAEVATAMDPQIRLLLELTFESLESAGIPMEKIAGSKTSVFAGTFTKDYHDRLLSDPLQTPRGLVTGNYSAMVANRISHFFDLKGPSTAIDTGCSTSLVGLHLACQSLRSGESDCAIIGGACINSNPDMFASLSSLGSCGPEGKCYAFDHRAQGYGRGEGAATLVVKRLEDAIRDGDPIRAVVRETALNQDGKSPTITSPNGAAQQDLIRECYERAGLNPRETVVVEAHGTGTAIGDPIEAEAIGRAFSPEGSHPRDDPVLIASVKTNLGHTEAASGIAGIIKMAKSIEHGEIAPSLNFEKANPKIDLHRLGLEVPRQLLRWPPGYRRRASVNNFGYGGTNAHIILDGAPNRGVTREGQEEVKSKLSPSKLFILSARNEKTVLDMALNLRMHLEVNQDIHLSDLAFTLGQRRSKLPWNLTIPSRSLQGLITSLSDNDLGPVKALGRGPKVGFVFNGQGSQWFAMGKELIEAYPIYLATLKKCEEAIWSFGGGWSLIDELTQDEYNSRVDQVQFSMPLTCAVQIALVCLLQSWGIRPNAVTGHSTGEVAAAFAAGAVSLQEAMAVTFFRGLLNSDHIASGSSSGSMMAVGMSPDDAKPYLDKLTHKALGQVVIACFNSPSSITLSGDTAAIEDLAEDFNSKGIFSRKLKVQAAFHSHHMVVLAESYGSVLEKNLNTGKRLFPDTIKFYSPTTGSHVQDAKILGPNHWVENLLLPVRFTESFSNMVLSENPDFIVEIGAHSTLAGPIRQILNEPSMKQSGIVYESCLQRGKDAVQTSQVLAGRLLQHGYPVDVCRVNFPKGTERLVAIPDLPSYPWNHTNRFWVESRISREHRFRKHPSHELLGVRMPGASDALPIWRLVLRTSELPWMRDHVVESKIVYPGAGLIAMAVEAARQLYDTQEKAVTGYSLREVELVKALIVPDDAEGVEVQLSLEPVDERSLTPNYRRFRIRSAPDGESAWNEVASGLVSVVRAELQPKDLGRKYEANRDESRLNANGYQRRLKPKELFDTLHGLGVQHGPSFRNIQGEILQGEGNSLTKLIVSKTTFATTEDGRDSHVIHPTTLDSVFQAAYPCLTKQGQQIVGAAVPRSMKALFISSDISHEPGSQLEAQATLLKHNKQGFSVSVAVHSTHSEAPVIEIGDMHFQSLGHMTEKNSDKDAICLVTEWKRSFSLNDFKPLVDSMRIDAPDDDKLIGRDLVRSTFYLVSDALKKLTSDDVSSMEWHHRKLHSWMLRLEEQAASNELAPRSSKWASSSPGVKQMHIDKVKKASASGQLSVRIGKNLVRILRQEVQAIELMMQDHLLYQFYEDHSNFKRSILHTTKLVRAIAEENPRVRILEIGAGTGACTMHVLQALSSDRGPLFDHYDFTDISNGFFQTARDKFVDWEEQISYTALDIEKDPIEQGFKEASYDIIIAAQVLHATKCMTKTMSNVKKLLKDDGKLILVETSKDTPEVQLIFGTLPGWWLSEEPGRESSPNMLPDAWDVCLKSSGFSGSEVHIWDCEDAEHRSHSCIMSSAAIRPQPSLGNSATLLHHGSQPPSKWTHALTQRFSEDLGISLVAENLSHVAPEGKVCVFISGIDSPSPQFDETAFNAMRRIITQCKALLWVTSGSAVDCEIPANALHIGLIRTARVENTSKRYISLDLDSSDSPWSLSSHSAIIRIFQRTMDFERDIKSVDTEYAVRNAEILVPRVCADSKESESLRDGLEEKHPELQPFVQPKHNFRMHVDTPGLLDSIVFREDPDAGLPLAEGYVEIKPRAFGLNFRDVMEAMGMLKEQKQEVGVECAGVVTRVRPLSTQTRTQDDLQVGDRVCAVTVHGHFANTVRVQRTSAARIPPSMSFETAASFVAAFLTAYYALFEAARCEPGDTVLIHAASGGVGQACIILAQWKDIEIFVTAGTPEKRRFLESQYSIPSDHIFSSRDEVFAQKIRRATGGRGVDVVINSLAGNLLHESWNLVAPHGRFVEIGKRDVHMNKCLEMEPFRKTLSFIHFDLVQLADNKGVIIQRMLQEVLSLLGSGTIPNITPVSTVPLGEIDRAFRTMQAGNHIGKIVLVPRPNELVKVIESPKRSQLRPDATYMIVGGLSGIGQSIARWFITHGARHLLLVSRNAASRAENSGFVKELARNDATVTVKNCDVGDFRSLKLVIDDCCTSGMPKIRGVINGGMMLDDSILERMTYSQWSNALRPKVNGTKNIEELLGHTLDFFVLLSSRSGVLGYPSQANYAAGNTYLDAVARHRSAKGLPCVALDLGVVQSVGIVADTQDESMRDRLLKDDGRPLSEVEVLALVDYAIRNPRRSPRTSQISPRLSGDVIDELGPRFSMLQEGTYSSHGDPVRSSRSSRAGPGSVVLHEQISRARSLDEAAGAVQNALITKISDMFVLPETNIDPSLPLSHYGVDSLVAVELRNWFVPNARAEVNIFDLIGSTSITELASNVVKRARPGLEAL